MRNIEASTGGMETPKERTQRDEDKELQNPDLTFYFIYLNPRPTRTAAIP